MTEAGFPLIGALFVFVVVLPLSALAAKGMLLLLERRSSGALHDLRSRYVVITASSILPLTWFLSAGLHQAEEWRSPLACLLDHETEARCFEPVLFSVLLAGIAALHVARSLRNLPRFRPSTSSVARDCTMRIDALVAEHSALHILERRVLVVDGLELALGTHGLVFTKVAVSTAFVAASSDDELVAALAHEAEHVRSKDSLRYAAMHLALALNPFGRAFLAPHAARWHVARELHCDREAVVRGADPLALADAIVRAARPAHVAIAGLGATDASVLSLRVHMLLAFADRQPAHCCKRDTSKFPVLIALIAFFLLLPHNTGTAALDAVHVGAEHLLSSLVR